MNKNKALKKYKIRELLEGVNPDLCLSGRWEDEQGNYCPLGTGWRDKFPIRSKKISLPYPCLTTLSEDTGIHILVLNRFMQVYDHLCSCIFEDTFDLGTKKRAFTVALDAAEELEKTLSDRVWNTQ